MNSRATLLQFLFFNWLEVKGLIAFLGDESVNANEGQMFNFGQTAATPLVKMTKAKNNKGNKSRKDRDLLDNWKAQSCRYESDSIKVYFEFRVKRIHRQIMVARL